MNTQKLIAIAGAVAINCAMLAGFHAVTAAQVASAHPAPSRVQDIVTLPAIHVHPTAAQLRELHRERTAAGPAQASVGGGVACLDMPYYSFATACTAAVVG